MYHKKKLIGSTAIGYARQSGISATMVAKLRDDGKLVFHPDGSIDVRASDALRAQETYPRGTVIDANAKPPDQPSTYLDARRANEILKAQERKLKLARLRGELVDRAEAIKVVRACARAERDALLLLPSRCCPAMAAELGVDEHRLRLAVEGMLREHLERPLPEYEDKQDAN